MLDGSDTGVNKRENKVTSEKPDYALRIVVGGSPATESPEGCVQFHLPVDGSHLDALEKSGLTSADTKTKTLVVLGENSLAALLVYSALCGMSSRTLDCEAGGTLCRFVSVSNPGGPQPEAAPEDLILLGVDLDFSEMLAGGNFMRVHAAKKVVLTGAFSTNPNLSPAEFLEIVQAVMLVASVRQRPGTGRYPSLYVSPVPDPSDEERIRQGDTSLLVDLEAARKDGEKVRRSSRTDDRSELMPPVDLTPRQRTLLAAAETDVERTLVRLNSYRNMDTGLWRCSRPGNHRNGDANPSSHVEDNKVRCYKCDLEPLDSLRLVVETLGLSPDDAAVWLASDK